MSAALGKETWDPKTNLDMKVGQFDKVNLTSFLKCLQMSFKFYIRYIQIIV